MNGLIVTKYIGSGSTLFKYNYNQKSDSGNGGEEQNGLSPVTFSIFSDVVAILVMTNGRKAH